MRKPVLLLLAEGSLRSRLPPSSPSDSSAPLLPPPLLLPVFGVPDSEAQRAAGETDCMALRSSTACIATATAMDVFCIASDACRSASCSATRSPGEMEASAMALATASCALPHWCIASVAACCAFSTAVCSTSMAPTSTAPTQRGAHTKRKEQR